ncbi:hypothetical protein D3C85_1908600 [compost metagenome]
MARPPRPPPVTTKRKLPLRLGSSLQTPWEPPGTEMEVLRVPSRLAPSETPWGVVRNAPVGTFNHWILAW